LKNKVTPHPTAGCQQVLYSRCKRLKKIKKKIKKEWNGMEWNGMEWNGMEWNGMEWNGMGNEHENGNENEQQKVEILSF
jgi:hypothetical protein